jgi:hypothetical protein
MLLEHRLDARCARASLDTRNRFTARDEHHSGGDLHCEFGDQVGALLDVHLHDAKAMTLLASDVRDETLHPPRRA